MSLFDTISTGKITGDLTSFFDWSGFLSTMDAQINTIILKGFLSNQLGAPEFLQGAIISMLLMSYVASAYVIVKAVEAGVDFTKGYYFNYADYSALGSTLYVFEGILVLGWQFWGLVQVILATSLAADAWSQLDARLVEAKQGSIGFETSLEWTLTIKSATLLMIVGIIMIVSGYSLGDIADEAISWVNEYDNDTNSDSAAKDHTAGTSASYDIAFHMVTALGGMFVMGIMSISSYIFTWTWLDIKNGNSEFECEMNPDADFSGIIPIFNGFKTREECIAGLGLIYPIAAQGDNFYSRCDDANLQYFFGSTEEYSKKFSSQFTREYLRVVCDQFPETILYE